MHLKSLSVITFALLASGCATLTSDPMVQIAMSFSNGESGNCILQNKRGVWNTPIPSTPYVRRSDDGLRYTCKTKSGKEAVGLIPSRPSSKIVASAIFLDFGIVDAITDKHREYPPSYVIPIRND